MPGYCTHLLVGEEVSKGLQLPEEAIDDFLFGCLAPDAQAARLPVHSTDIVETLWNQAHRWDHTWNRWKHTLPFHQRATFSELNVRERKQVTDAVANLESVAPFMIPALGFLRRPLESLRPYETAFVLGVICHLATDESWIEFIAEIFPSMGGLNSDKPDLSVLLTVMLDLSLGIEFRGRLIGKLEAIRRSSHVDVLTYVDAGRLTEYKKEVIAFLERGFELIADGQNGSFVDRWRQLQRHLLPESALHPQREEKALAVLASLDRENLMYRAVKNSRTRLTEFLEAWYRA